MKEIFSSFSFRHESCYRRLLAWPQIHVKALSVENSRKATLRAQWGMEYRMQNAIGHKIGDKLKLLFICQTKTKRTGEAVWGRRVFWFKSYITLFCYDYSFEKLKWKPCLLKTAEKLSFCFFFWSRDQFFVTMTKNWSWWQFQLSLWPNFCHDGKKLVTRPQFQLSSRPNFCHDDKNLVTMAIPIVIET